MPLCIVAVQEPGSGAWRFSQLRGLPFGLGSAVNQFNRSAELSTAVCRRCLYILTGHAADDSAAVEVARNASRTQKDFQQLSELKGIRLSESKSQAAAAMCTFLGHAHDFTRLRSDGSLLFGPKLGFREQLVKEIRQIILLNKLGSGRASKLRGKFTWLDTGLLGRVCRGALAALTARQYYEHSEEVHENLLASLLFLEAAAAYHPERAVPLLPEETRPVLVYTDASAEHGKVRIGALVVVPGRSYADALVYDVPTEVQQLWGEHKTIINQAELHAAPLVVTTLPESLRGREVIWFVDNTSAETSLVKSGSPTETMCSLALVASAALTGIGARTWF